MRLKLEKVEDLCRQIVTALKRDQRVKLLVSAETAERALRKLFLDDLQRENDVMAEVDRIMEAHRSKIVGKNIDVRELRRKIREQLVRQRKIVL